ncbi:alpha-glucan family phosphorylase [Leptolyngbya sp. 7M]|uniref:alpha-glucan family phosphorylase n=1 Tax=Leptolyngbya sp. 7M TaxID=2812896 RepID=UPI001B8AA2C8|nr:alpha-glucan family phosphorylase [Leptolyngbya sp. 7M]QYO68105.1 alpha-glucan family phosphorylase [Leptolyngbya sp. 7M]
MSTASSANIAIFGRVDPNDENELFGMTPFALRMSRSANGVAKKHGEVSRELWRAMFPANQPVPITYVTNGVHAPTWIAPAFQNLYKNEIGADWKHLLSDPDAWKGAVAQIPLPRIWQTHQVLKDLLVAFIRQRTQKSDTGTKDTINERSDTNRLLDPNALTIGFARRVAQYKRWNLILFDRERLLRLVNNDTQPVQFVFAGKAHPQDRTAKQILQELMSIDGDSSWQQRAVFIEDYDQEVARYLVQGVDVWMNVPRRPFEASGTSGMKAAMNGVLNLSILDGWWVEGYNGRNGFAVGDMRDFDSDDEIDAIESDALYSLLENEIVPKFYDRGDDGISVDWVAMMKEAIATLTPQFSSDRMVRDYFEKIYG